MSEKIKVLWLSDFNCATGFAQVAHNILGQLQETGLYEFTVIGINHHGEPYDQKKWDFPIYPARNIKRAGDPRYMDLFGRQRLLDELGTGKYDIVFTLQDTFIMEEIGEAIINTKNELVERGMKPFKWIFYFPVDGPLKPNWVEKAVALSDIPVAYTEYGKAEALKHWEELNIKVVYHGVDTSVFKPLPRAERREFKKKFFAGFAEGKFVVTNVNRNQRRKDIPRTIAAFALFKKQRPESLLYLHMRHHDVGGNILEMARHWGLEPTKDFVVPDKFDEHTGYPVEIVNKIYNVSDVVVSTTLGEGWGLSSIEAMAAKVPVLFPANTALNEIIGDDVRGTKFASGATKNSFICLGDEDMNQFRPTADIEDMAAKLVDLYDKKLNAEEKAERAFEWVQTLSWDTIGEQWKAIFKEASPVPAPKKTLGVPQIK